MLRVALVGIDGSGKTSTALKLVQRLAPQLDVCKPGRPPVVTRGGQLDTFRAADARALEQHLRRADRTGKRWRVALARRRYLSFVTGVERQMARRFSPELMLTARCPRVDPAVYLDFYFPRLARALSMETRLRLCDLSARVPARDLYCLLDTPPEVAMARIVRRLDDLNRAQAESGREHWLHLHEQQDVLAALARGMEQALGLVRRRTGADLVTVDNSDMRPDGVVELLAERILWLQRGRRSMSVPRPVCHEQISELDVSRVAPLAPLREGRPRDRWVVLTARTARGAEAHLVRFSGHAAAQPHEPEPLSSSFLVRGDAAAGAWGGEPRDPRALVAYHEPSRTEVWGLIVDSQARVQARPFVVAAAQEDHLLCDDRGRGTLEVTWEPQEARWQVTIGSHSARARGGPPDLAERVMVGPDGAVERAPS